MGSGIRFTVWLPTVCLGAALALSAYFATTTIPTGIMLAALVSIVTLAVAFSFAYAIQDRHSMATSNRASARKILERTRAWTILHHAVRRNVGIRIDLRTITTFFREEQTMTCNTVTVDADAVLFWRVTGPQRAALEVEKHADAVAMAAQTALRDVIGLRLRSSTTEQKMHFARRANRLGAEDQKMRSIVWRIYSPATDMTDEEVWRAIRYLDPDRRRNAWDMASAIAIVVACVVWYWLIFAAS